MNDRSHCVKPKWPRANVDKLRADARAGWTQKECAMRHNFNPATVALHAKLNGIEFKEASPVRRDMSARGDHKMHQDFLDRERSAAARQLRKEIAAAIEESTTAPLYRGGWPGDV